MEVTHWWSEWLTQLWIHQSLKGYGNELMFFGVQPAVQPAGGVVLVLEETTSLRNIWVLTEIWCTCWRSQGSREKKRHRYLPGSSQCPFDPLV